MTLTPAKPARHDRLPIEADRILRAARKASDRELLALGRAWLRRYPAGYPSTALLDRTMAAYRTFQHNWDREVNFVGSINVYGTFANRATKIGQRVHVPGPRPDNRRTPDQCIRIALEAAMIGTVLAGVLADDDAHELLQPWLDTIGHG